MARMDGKVLLLFGAGPNNGGTIAHFMAREGAKVAVNDIVPAAAEETAEFLKSRGYDAISIPGDASDEQVVQDIVKRTVGHFGYVDTMVNLAGRQYRWPVTDVNTDEWNDQIRTYLTAGMFTTKYTAKAMLDKGKKGCIIHLISTAGHYGEAGNSGYSAAKAGLLNFSRAAAMDLAHAGIRVNTVTPYAMEHNLWGFMRRGGSGPAPDGERTRYSITREDVLRVIPLGRFPRASDLAWAALYLASDEAEFITGVDIPVDGGTRFRYPSWRPGDYPEANMVDYAKNLKITRYGEPMEDFPVPWPS